MCNPVTVGIVEKNHKSEILYLISLNLLTGSLLYQTKTFNLRWLEAGDGAGKHKTRKQTTTETANRKQT